MKKVSILSMQRVNNFGSLLQSYSLMKILNSLGCDVKFIDIESYECDNNLINETDFIDSDISNKNLLSKLKKIDRYFLNRISIKRKDKIQVDIFEEFRGKVLKICKENNNQKYDTCVIGSDEVFNCASKSKWGFTSQLFGNVRNANKVITYAASCGETSYENLNNEVILRIKESFKNISSFSVRDCNTYNFVTKLCNKKPTFNLDPVLIGNFDEEIKNCSFLKLPKKFCIVYSYYNRFNNKEEIKTIKKFCKKNKMTLITIGAPQFWIKKHLVLNPFEVLYAFSRAEYVITDTFHGTIFASKYSKRFATIIRKSNRNKLGDLLKRLKQDEHLCINISEIKDKYNLINDKKQIKTICEEERIKSIDYLKHNL